jgi:hypothetical protein
MGIFKAIGLGIAILVLQWLVPQVFTEIEKTAVLFLQGAQASAITATNIAASAGSAPSLALPPASILPHTPGIVGY